MENLVPDVAVDAVSESGCKLVKYLPKLVTPVAFFGGAILLYTFYKRKKAKKVAAQATEEVNPEVE